MSEGKSKNRSTKKVARSEQAQPVAATHAGAEIGLPPPGSALTQLPEELRPGYRRAALGSRSVRASVSGYVARLPELPTVDLRTPELIRTTPKQVVERVLALRDAVANGRLILEAMADGALVSWHARMTLGKAMSAYGLNPDTDQYFTVGERVALVDAVLTKLGYVKPKRVGGWTIGGSR